MSNVVETCIGRIGVKRRRHPKGAPHSGRSQDPISFGGDRLFVERHPGPLGGGGGGTQGEGVRPPQHLQ